MTRRRRAFAVAGLVAAVATASAVGIASARERVRTVHLTIRYSSFGAAPMTFAPGETVRFVVENADPIDHEFILGDRTVQILHERGTEAHHAPRPGEMTVVAGATEVTTYTFAAPGSLIIGCHLPGHYAFGMRVPVSVE